MCVYLYVQLEYNATHTHTHEANGFENFSIILLRLVALVTHRKTKQKEHKKAHTKRAREREIQTQIVVTMPLDKVFLLNSSKMMFNVFG